jgi:hypothetical protein
VPAQNKIGRLSMATRIHQGRARLLTRIGLDWTEQISKHYRCAREGEDEDCLHLWRPLRRGRSRIAELRHAQAASDSERDVLSVHYAIDLLHIGTFQACSSSHALVVSLMGPGLALQLRA